MFSIGDFAKLGRVSVRMLRHYDAIGLLRPAVVHPTSGYRLYRADQLRRLNRVIALKDLGFTLPQVRRIVDDEITAEQLRGMLRLRRAQLEAQLAADAARLTGVEARLRTIEREGQMATEDVILKEIAAVRVAELTGTADSYQAEDIAPVIQPLYQELFRRLDAAGMRVAGSPIAYYEPVAGQAGGAGAAGQAGGAGEAGQAGGAGEAITVHAAATVDPGQAAAAGDAADGAGIAVVDLPRIPTAATIIHRGDLAEADRSLQLLGRWIDDNGYRMVGYAREVCLEFDSDDPAKWVHELQVTVARD